MTIRFYSDYFSTDGKCNEIEVEVIPMPYAADDCGWELEYIFDNTADQERQLEDFPDKEQRAIEHLVDRYIYDNTHSLWYDQQIAYADAMADAYKDGTLK